MRQRLRARHVILFAWGLALPTAVFAATTLRDGFDKENGGVAQLNYAAFRHFTVTAGQVDLIGNGTNDLYPGHGLYVDMCGSGNACGTMTTKMMFPVGTYQVILKLAGNDRDNVPDGVNITFGTSSNDFMAKAYNKPFTAKETVSLTKPAALSVSDLGLDSVLHGTILFSVSISPVH
jgi:hypothetical protein